MTAIVNTDLSMYRDNIVSTYLQLQQCRDFILDPVKKRELDSVIATLKLRYESISSPNPFFIQTQSRRSNQGLSDFSVFAAQHPELMRSPNGQLQLQAYAAQRGLDPLLATRQVQQMTSSNQAQRVEALAMQLESYVVQNMGYTDGSRSQIMARIKTLLSSRVEAELIDAVANRLFGMIVVT